jgi:hypothetical protein
MKMKYEVIKQLSQGEVEAAILRNDPQELSLAVLSAALYFDDSDWAEDVCLRLSKHEHFNVRGNAILGFGHIARIHGKLNQKQVKPIIEAALNDENDFVKGQADGAADDVEWFLKWKINRPTDH